MVKIVFGEIFVVIIVFIRKNKDDKIINVRIFEIKKLDIYEKNKFKECRLKKLIKSRNLLYRY